MLRIIHHDGNEAIEHPSVYFDTMAQEVLNQGLNLRFRVSGSSMYPFIQAGNILLIEPKKPAGFHIGDVIFCRRPSGSYVVHRLIKKNGSETLITKGDNLSSYDEPFLAEQVMGRVIRTEGHTKQIKLNGFFGRILSWFMARLALGRHSNQTRLRRNIGRIWWLIGGRRVA